MKIVQNFGAGTQSVGLTLMALDAKFGDIDFDIVFADTFSEPEHVYDYLEMFKDYIKTKYSKEITTVEFKSLENEIVELFKGSVKRLSNPPLFTSNGGMINRGCTQDYKIAPIEKWIKNKHQIGRKSKESKPTIEQWIGISLEERSRMKISQKWWTILRYPLCEERMYRSEVIKYVTEYHNLPEPPRSSCYFCPFHSNDYWRFLKDRHNNEFSKAIEIDKMLRKIPGMEHETYLHRSMKPLNKVDLRTGSEKGEPELIDECNGYCGT